MRRIRWYFPVGIASLLMGCLGVSIAQEKSIEGGLQCYVVFDRRFEKDPIPEEAKSCDLVTQVKERSKFKSEMNRTGSFHDPIADRGLYPTLAVFSRSIPTNAEDPIMALLKRQNQFLAKTDDLRYNEYRSARLGTFAVFMSLKKEIQNDPDRDKLIQSICNAGRAGNLTSVLLGLTEATQEKDGNMIPNPDLTKLGIEPSDEVVVLLYNRLQVVESWKFSKDKPPTAEDIEKIATAVDTLVLKPKRK